MINVISEDRSLFRPDAIATALHHALFCDLGGSRYLSTSSLPMLREAHDDFFCKGQIHDFLKKYKSQDASEFCRQEAFSKFRKICLTISDVNRNICLPDPRIRLSKRTMSRRDRILVKARNLCSFILGELDIEAWFNSCKNSAGTSLGLKFEKTNLEDKLTFPITVTSRCRPIFDQYLEFDQMLDSVLNDVNKFSLVHSPKYEIVDGSRGTTVDKNDETDRFIAVEPTGNMFLQQGLMLEMYRLLSPYLDFDVQQDIHRFLAYIGSITKQLGTLDWTEASNCSSFVFCRWFFPVSWFNAFYLTRTDFCDVDGESVKLPMISTMGNATTFPIESIIFYCIAAATVDTDTNSGLVNPDCLKKVSVFGDDCILPSESCTDFVSVLESVGFILNQSKSFFGTEYCNSFRESCGGDYFSGRNVRPYHLKAPLDTRLTSMRPWLYTIWNRLLKKYKSYFGDLTYVYQSVFDVLIKCLAELGEEIHVVPAYFPEDSGLHIMDDIARWRPRMKSLRLSNVTVDCHGLAHFSFLRFKYKKASCANHFARYWQWLKAVAQEEVDCKTNHFLYLRNAGTIVLCHGSLPTGTPRLTLTLNRKGKVVCRVKHHDEDYVSKKIGSYVVSKGDGFF